MKAPNGTNMSPAKAARAWRAEVKRLRGLYNGMAKLAACHESARFSYYAQLTKIADICGITNWTANSLPARVSTHVKNLKTKKTNDYTTIY
jgi:hypothetical protein